MQGLDHPCITQLIGVCREPKLMLVSTLPPGVDLRLSAHQQVNYTTRLHSVLRNKLFVLKIHIANMFWVIIIKKGVMHTTYLLNQLWSSGW